MILCSYTCSWPRLLQILPLIENDLGRIHDIKIVENYISDMLPSMDERVTLECDGNNESRDSIDRDFIDMIETYDMEIE